VFSLFGLALAVVGLGLVWSLGRPTGSSLRRPTRSTGAGRGARPGIPGLECSSRRSGSGSPAASAKEPSRDPPAPAREVEFEGGAAPARAARLLGAAAAARRALGTPLLPIRRPDIAAAEGAARAALGTPAYVAARAAGEALSLEEAADEALAAPPSPA
jgi:hypothetical protein